MTPGLLFPEVPALVSWAAEHELEIANFATNDRTEATGRIAEEVRAFFETGDLGPALQVLPGDHALRAALNQLGPRHRLTLSPATALQLDRFDTLFLELTGRCTARCLHCYAEADAEVDSALDQETCEAVLREAAGIGFRRVQLTGGEPLTCDYLPDLVALAHELGVPTCEIFTNGMLLDDALLDRLAPHEPSFAFSFYSHDPETHDSITRAPKSHALTSSAIRRSVERGLETRVAIIVMAENARHVAQTLRYVREELGAKNTSAKASSAAGRGRLFTGDYDIGEDETEEDAGRCREFLGKACVSHDGTVYPCIFNRTTRLGSIRERTLGQILAAPELPVEDDLTRDEFLESVGESLACVECRLIAYALRRLSRRTE